MKNRAVGTIINLAVFAFWLIVAAVFMLFVYSKFNMSGLDLFIYSLTGFLLNYAIALFLHELGHVVFAGLLKIKIQYVNFGLFSVDTLAKKKVKWFTYFNGNAGETAFLPKKKLTKKRIKLIAFGGILFSFIYAVACALPLLFSESQILFCIFGIGSCSAYYLLTVNLLPLDKTSDGALVLQKGEYAEILAEVGNHQKLITLNQIPEEPLIFKKSNQPLAVYFHYLHLVMQNRKEEGFWVIESLNDSLSQLTDDEYTLIFPELLYIACVKGECDEEFKSRAEIFFTEESANPAFIRAHYVFRKHEGEKEWANALKSSYYKSLKNAPEFIKLVEKQFNVT